MTTTRHISTSHEEQQCDICGRTLLRGEHADDFLDGSQLHPVCVLCENVALREGWVRAQSVADLPVVGSNAGRRRSLFGRRARAKDDGRDVEVDDELDDPMSLDDELAGRSRSDRDSARRRGRGRRREYDEFALDDGPDATGPREPSLASREHLRREDNLRAPHPDAAPAADTGGRDRRRRHPARDARQIHAIPIDVSQKIDAAIYAFNESQFPRVIAGLGRSLGAPSVEVRPDPRVGTLVWIVIAWELCWYRYEIELSTDPAYVRQDSQGDELSELGSFQFRPNARIERDGRLLR